jgi:hypothetical protein
MDCATTPSYKFVNLNHPDDLKDKKLQLRVRRLAMSEFGRSRRKPKTKKERNEIVLEFRNLHEIQPDFDRISGGSIDPFTSYPVPLDSAARGLLANSEWILPS